MTHSVQQHLGLDVRDYDRIIRNFIPGYDVMLGRAALAVGRVDPELVVDLGAGTGGLSERVLQEVPDTVVELWDVDDAMLTAARQRLHAHPHRARYLHRAFGEPLPPCQAVTASLALHHIRALDQKAALYRLIWEALTPGGVFVNADITIPIEPEGRERAYRAWADHLIRSGIPESRAWAHFDEWAGEDRYFSREEELDALTRAGFAAEVAWYEEPATLIVATKPREA
jgi:tRNA (cmo5U34)-methyltransferase